MLTFAQTLSLLVSLVLPCGKAQSRKARASVQEIKVLALLIQVISVMKFILSCEKVTILNGES
jgi:hypothetical protein